MAVKNRKNMEDFHHLCGKQKIQYIWDYYKLPLAIACLIILVAIYSIHRYLSYKDTALYMALVNVNIGETLTEQLTDDFLEESSIDTSKNKIHLYSGLYLTEDETNEHHQYTYASRMKILGAIDSEQLDIVLMNKEAFDAFAQNGYLCNIEKLLLEDETLYRQWKQNVVSNTVILEDNFVDAYLDKSITYNAKTEEYPMGLDVSNIGLFEQAGFDDTVYLGVVKNSPHKSTTLSYLNYLQNVCG